MLDTADEELLSVSASCSVTGLSIGGGVADWTVDDSVLVVRDASVGLISLTLLRSACRFLNVFLEVGDVDESVSNLRLVEAFPKTGATPVVLSESFGLFDGEGPGNCNVGIVGWLKVIGDDGSTAIDIVPVASV